MIESTEACVAKAQASADRIQLDRHFESLKIEQQRQKLLIEGRAMKETENEAGRFLASRVSEKIKQIKRLIEDLDTDFENGLISNDYRSSYVEQVDRVVDDLLSSLRSGSIMIN